jgi:hypothetical protein
MKRAILVLLALWTGMAARAQKDVFLQVLENKKVCNKEDVLTYFLQANHFERRANSYYYHYPVGKRFYNTVINNENECYVTYQTDNAADYKSIYNEITASCAKETSPNKAATCYVCNYRRMQDVQVTFLGYNETNRYYEILVYQNPEMHEPPYYPADRTKAQRKY